MLHMIFCDDNGEFLAEIKRLTQKTCMTCIPKDEKYIIGKTFGGGLEVLKYIKETPVDILFLDIDMPNLNGFEVAKVICKEYSHIKIIFMSAYDNFVYSTFNYSPFAYLRKSHIADELPDVIKRIVDKAREENAQLSVISTEGLKIIKMASIVYVESCRNYSRIHLVDGKEYVCRGSLSSYEEKLAKYDFFRIHSAYLVNLAHVERILNSANVLVKGFELPIAQKRSQEFRKAYMAYMRRNISAW